MTATRSLVESAVTDHISEVVSALPTHSAICDMLFCRAQHLSFLLQALTLWLQYLTILGSTNVNVPSTIKWVFQASSFAFASVNSSVLSTDCLIDTNGSVDPALKRLVLRFAIPWFSLVILMVAVILRSVFFNNSQVMRPASQDIAW